jgi:hypothetical protein
MLLVLEVNLVNFALPNFLTDSMFPNPVSKTLCCFVFLGHQTIGKLQQPIN